MVSDGFFINILKKNESFIEIKTNSTHIRKLISDRFSYVIPNYKYTPAGKRGWNGRISLLNNGMLPIGLKNDLILFLNETQIHHGLDSRLLDTELKKEIEYSSYRELRDYQIIAVETALYKKKCLILSPTSSGKSYILHNIICNLKDRKILILVPTINLVKQLASDFVEYGYSEHISQIYANQSKENLSNITISTWQSLQKEKPSFFEQFKVVIVDEVHTAKANKLQYIVSKAINAKYKIGVTGTLPDSEADELVIKSLFGEVQKVASTVDLIDKGYLSNFDIDVYELNYSQQDKFDFMNLPVDLHSENQFLSENQSKIDFISNKALEQDGNVLILFQFLAQGKLLVDKLSTMTNRRVLYIDGSVSAEKREEYRQLIMSSNDIIIVASVQLFSTGINIPNLNTVLFGFSSKSKIRILQSIGRVLRKSDGKNSAKVIDIIDNLCTKNRQNFSFRHGFERLEIYKKQNFIVKLITHEISC